MRVPSHLTNEQPVVEDLPTHAKQTGLDNIWSSGRGSILAYKTFIHHPSVDAPNTIASIRNNGGIVVDMTYQDDGKHDLYIIVALAKEHDSARYPKAIVSKLFPRAKVVTTIAVHAMLAKVCSLWRLDGFQLLLKPLTFALPIQDDERFPLLTVLGEHPAIRHDIEAVCEALRHGATSMNAYCFNPGAEYNHIMICDTDYDTPNWTSHHDPPTYSWGPHHHALGNLLWHHRGKLNEVHFLTPQYLFQALQSGKIPKYSESSLFHDSHYIRETYCDALRDLMTKEIPSRAVTPQEQAIYHKWREAYDELNTRVARENGARLKDQHVKDEDAKGDEYED